METTSRTICSTTTRTTSRSARWAASEYYGDRIYTGFYANDSWKATPHLTVNVGLRYEYQTVPYSETQQTVNAISNVPGLIVFQKPTAMKNAWMPRVGLAYSPGTSGKTSIRAGFGRSFDVLVDNFGLLTLPPQDTTTVDVTGLNQAGIPGWRRHSAERFGGRFDAGPGPCGHGRVRSQPGAPRIAAMEHRHPARVPRKLHL